MPSFRERPLTWLFLIATLCLDAVALSTDSESAFASGLAMGQLFAASGWLVVGRAHRLTRAAVWVAAIALLTAPDYVIPRLKSGFYVDLTWPVILAPLIALGVATVVNAGLWRCIVRGVSKEKSEFRLADWQFSLAEIFGWTIIVAIASVGLRLADFSYLTDLKELAIGFGLANLAGTLAAVTLGGGEKGRDWPAPLAMILAGMSLSLVTIALLKAIPADSLPADAGAIVYVACWCVALKLDRRKEAREALAIEAAPPLKLFAEER